MKYRLEVVEESRDFSEEEVLEMWDDYIDKWMMI